MWQAIPPTIGEEEIEVHHRATKQENHPADNSLIRHTKAAGEDPPEQDNQPGNQEDGGGKRRLQALHVMRVIALKNENVPAEQPQEGQTHIHCVLRHKIRIRQRQPGPTIQALSREDPGRHGRKFGTGET